MAELAVMIDGRVYVAYAFGGVASGLFEPIGNSLLKLRKFTLNLSRVERDLRHRQLSRRRTGYRRYRTRLDHARAQSA